MSFRHPLRALHRPCPSSATWTAAVERYRRAVGRYHESLQLIHERDLRLELAELGGLLDAVLDDFEDALAHRSQLGPARQVDLVAGVHRAATLCAHATEAALLAHEAARHSAHDDVGRRLDTVRELVRTIDELGDQATPGA